MVDVRGDVKKICTINENTQAGPRPTQNIFSPYLGGGLTNTAPLTIHVLDINDNAPTFQTNNYRVLIKENDIQYN